MTQTIDPAASADIYCGLLAGGVGTRMREFVRSWINEDRPKQFCRFTGGQMMIESAYERSLRLAPSNQIFTLVTDGQQSYLSDAADVGELLVQPDARGTATGIALLLARILARDENAIAVILPADHFIYPVSRFVANVQRAVEHVRRSPDAIVTLGAVPDRAEPDYGWIARGADDRLLAFHEKPDAELAEEYFEAGYLWNTMITVARARELWDTIGRHAPAITNVLDAVVDRPTIGLTTLFADLPAVDFSSQIIENCVDQMRCVALEDVLWSDWGRPERLLETVGTLNIRHQIPNDLAHRYAPRVVGL